MIRKGSKIIASKAVFCRSFFSKAMGLRFKRLRSGEAYVFVMEKPARAVMDMWFVFFPIDVVFLNEKKRVVELKENFLPFTFYSSRKAAKTIIELKKGAVKKFAIKIGDKISLEV